MASPPVVRNATPGSQAESDTPRRRRLMTRGNRDHAIRARGGDKSRQR